MNEKRAVLNQTNTKQDIEEYVTFVRLELYNKGLPYGARRSRKDWPSLIVLNPFHL